MAISPPRSPVRSTSTLTGQDGSATSERIRVFVVGLGMVGLAFIEKMLSQDQEGRYKIITVGEEKHLAYNRVGLTDYFLHRKVDELYLNQPEWYREQDPDRFEFHVGEQVNHIDTENKVVQTNRTTFEYDICVIATGSNAGFTPYCTAERAKRTKGVFVYRNIADLENIMHYAERPGVRHATVVGGGLLGLEAAKAVYDLKVPEVSIINRQGYPLSRQLDEEGGEMVLRKIEAMGVQVFVNVNVEKMAVDKEDDGTEVFKGFEFTDGESLEADLVIFAVGITPRDELARESGIKVSPRGGIAVDDNLMTSAQDVYAVGECASWRGNTYGLIGPGVEMADILAFNLCQTKTSLGNFRPRKMNAPDLSTKLKLMGVDVASFGDFFADKAMGRMQQPLVETMRNTGTPDHPNTQVLSNTHVPGEPDVPQTGKGPEVREGRMTKRVKIHVPKQEEPIKCLTYKMSYILGMHELPPHESEPDLCFSFPVLYDPFGAVYKKYIFSADGKHLLGGILVGDVSDFVKLVAIIKKKKPLDAPPSQFIIGSKSGGEDDGGDLDDDAQICSCHNVTKGMVASKVKDGSCKTIGDIKTKTKAGAGCGGCMQLVQNIFNAEMKKAGHAVSNNICEHFALSRKDLYAIVKVKNLDNFPDVMREAGVNKESLGCDVCKPVIGNLISSMAINKHVMDPIHHSNQDTNDRFMANIQRDGTFSVVPRMPAGEVTPDGLLAIANVAKKYNLYTKITGGQRIDLFGARKQDLPDIWEALVKAGFETGQAYGKSLRTVKSCVGTTWCRYGVGDSVGLAVQLEERYKGIRSPHKIKGGVSGCVRECAEAQSKDFGLIATDKGWNIYVGGNGGTRPRHAVIFATDVPPSKVVRIIDRFLMFYIKSADRLQRTAPWVEQFEGGVDKLRKILIDDELGICGQLEKDMDALVGTFECEWTRVVNEPERRKQFRQHVNTSEATVNVEKITERTQTRAADWPKEFPPVKMNDSMIPTPKSEWTWKKVALLSDLTPTDTATTSCSVKIGDSQIAIFNVPSKGLYATQQMCPHKRAFVLDHGIIGDDKDGNVYVSCPLHKRRFNLEGGDCLNDPEYSIISFDVKEENGDLYLRLPPSGDLDEAIGTSKWMVKQATADVIGRGAATALSNGSISLVGPDNMQSEEQAQPNGGGCSNHKLEW